MNAVCNASPIISLAKAGLIHVLHELFDHVVVTGAVIQEVEAGGESDPGCRAVSQLSWIEHVVLDPSPSRLSIITLGAGEAEAIEWALRYPDYIAILDDRAARRTAEALGVRCAGTLRVLYEASRQGLVDSFPKAVATVKDTGLYCDQRLSMPLSKDNDFHSSPPVTTTCGRFEGLPPRRASNIPHLGFLFLRTLRLLAAIHLRSLRFLL